MKMTSKCPDVRQGKHAFHLFYIVGNVVFYLGTVGHTARSSAHTAGGRHLGRICLIIKQQEIQCVLGNIKNNPKDFTKKWSIDLLCNICYILQGLCILNTSIHVTICSRRLKLFNVKEFKDSTCTCKHIHDKPP